MQFPPKVPISIVLEGLQDLKGNTVEKLTGGIKISYAAGCTFTFIKGLIEEGISPEEAISTLENQTTGLDLEAINLLLLIIRFILKNEILSTPDYGIPPDTVVHDGVFSQAPSLWHLPKDKWASVWEKVTGRGIKLAILDTGYVQHPDLPSPVATRSFVSGESISDGNGHGTHCAGTALGRNGLGVAPNAELIVGKVLSNSGSGGSAGIAAGIKWAADSGADVISMSLGGGGSDTGTNQAIDYAYSKGCIVNAAAGNSGYNGNNTIGWPARYLGCLCTAAYRKDGEIASFSSGGREIDWACPGQDIISCNRSGGYVSMSGTSMATPFGSGVLALVVELLRREGNPNWTAIDAVRAFIKANSKDMGQPGFDVRFGWGVPIVESIVAGLINEDIKYV